MSAAAAASTSGGVSTVSWEWCEHTTRGVAWTAYDSATIAQLEAGVVNGGSIQLSAGWFSGKNEYVVHFNRGGKMIQENTNTDFERTIRRSVNGVPNYLVAPTAAATSTAAAATTATAAGAAVAKATSNPTPAAASTATAAAAKSKKKHVSSKKKKPAAAAASTASPPPPSAPSASTATTTATATAPAAAASPLKKKTASAAHAMGAVRSKEEEEAAAVRAGFLSKSSHDASIFVRVYVKPATAAAATATDAKSATAAAAAKAAVSGTASTTAGSGGSAAGPILCSKDETCSVCICELFEDDTAAAAATAPPATGAATATAAAAATKPAVASTATAMPVTPTGNGAAAAGGGAIDSKSSAAAIAATAASSSSAPAMSNQTAVKLSKCGEGHFFHYACIKKWLEDKHQCPTCKTSYGVTIGTQPIDGATMNVQTYDDQSLPGYENCGMIEISYSFSGGVQGSEHPHPGRKYPSDHRTAYLPNNAEGKAVLSLLKTAWQRRLVFSIGQSITRGGDRDLVIWNGIHHKTSPSGGAANFGYPDPTYLKRVTEELAQKGVVA